MRTESRRWAPSAGCTSSSFAICVRSTLVTALRAVSAGPRVRARPPKQTVIITGRAAKPELVDLADTVSEIADRKHAYKAGVKAQAGIDF